MTLLKTRWVRLIFFQSEMQVIYKKSARISHFDDCKTRLLVVAKSGGALGIYYSWGRGFIIPAPVQWLHGSLGPVFTDPLSKEAGHEFHWAHKHVHMCIAHSQSYGPAQTQKCLCSTHIDVGSTCKYTKHRWLAAFHPH